MSAKSNKIELSEELMVMRREEHLFLQNTSGRMLPKFDMNVG